MVYIIDIIADLGAAAAAWKPQTRLNRWQRLHGGVKSLASSRAFWSNPTHASQTLTIMVKTKIGRSTVESGGAVTVTGNEVDSLLPPVTGSSEGLFSVGPHTVTSGGPVTVTGNEASVTVTEKNYAQLWGEAAGQLARILVKSQPCLYHTMQILTIIFKVDHSGQTLIILVKP